MVDLCTFWKGLLQCWLTETTLLQPARSNQTFKISSGEVGLKLFHFLVDLQLCQIKIIQKKTKKTQQNSNDDSSFSITQPDHLQ